MTTLHTLNILLLAENESLVAVDRAALRRLGASRVRFMSRGEDALRMVKNQGRETLPPNMLVCHERLADMTGLAFLLSLRRDPDTTDLPLVLLAGNRESVLVRKALACGGCALLARPYTQNEALSALCDAQSKKTISLPVEGLATPVHASLPSVSAAPGRVPDDNAAPGFLSKERSLRAVSHGRIPGPPTACSSKSASEADLFWGRGLNAMRDGNAAEAEKALTRAVALDPLHVEACLALSKIKAISEAEEESLSWLCQAGVASLRRREPERARVIFSRLPQIKNGPNPLANAAARLLQEGETRAAAFVFLEAGNLEPDRPLHSLIGRASLFTDAPEKSMRSLCKVLSQEGYDTVARALQNRLFADMSPREEALPSRFWDRFPVLRDIISVASFTFSAWKQAA